MGGGHQTVKKVTAASRQAAAPVHAAAENENQTIFTLKNEGLEEMGKPFSQVLE